MLPAHVHRRPYMRNTVLFLAHCIALVTVIATGAAAVIAASSLLCLALAY